MTELTGSSTAGFGRHLSTWHVRIELFQDGDQTAARAFLVNGQGVPFEAPGVGVIGSFPGAAMVSEIGEEVAVAKALSALGEQLMAAAAEDADDVVRTIRSLS